MYNEYPILAPSYGTCHAFWQKKGEDSQTEKLSSPPASYVSSSKPTSSSLSAFALLSLTLFVLDPNVINTTKKC